MELIVQVIGVALGHDWPLNRNRTLTLTLPCNLRRHNILFDLKLLRLLGWKILELRERQQIWHGAKTRGHRLGNLLREVDQFVGSLLGCITL